MTMSPILYFGSGISSFPQPPATLSSYSSESSPVLFSSANAFAASSAEISIFSAFAISSSSSAEFAVLAFSKHCDFSQLCRMQFILVINPVPCRPHKLCAVSINTVFFRIHLSNSTVDICFVKTCIIFVILNY